MPAPSSFDPRKLALSVLLEALRTLTENYEISAEDDSELLPLPHPASAEVRDGRARLIALILVSPLANNWKRELVRSLETVRTASDANLYCGFAAWEPTFMERFMTPLFDALLFSDCPGFDSQEAFSRYADAFFFVYYERVRNAGGAMPTAFVRLMWKERALVQSVAAETDLMYMEEWEAIPAWETLKSMSS